MDLHRRVSFVAGLLFIVATVTNVIGVALSASLLEGSDFLRRVSDHADRVATGALLELVAAGASVGIAISLYPVLRLWSHGQALGSVVFRTLESAMYAVGVLALLALVSLSREAATSGGPPRVVGEVLIDIRRQAALVSVLAFSVGALLYYLIFFRSMLVPRWLSGWGIVAVLFAWVAWLLALFQDRAVTSYVPLFLPIGLQEMVLAVWLLAKGFSHADGRTGPWRSTGSSVEQTSTAAPSPRS